MMHCYLGLEVLQGPNEVYLGQGKYVIEILKSFDIMDYKPMTTPVDHYRSTTYAVHPLFSWQKGVVPERRVRASLQSSAA